MIIFIDRTFKERSGCQRVFLTLTCWLYNVKFFWKLIFFSEMWRCVDGFAFPNISKGHSVYIIKVK